MQRLTYPTDWCYRSLGKSGLKISKIVLGAMSFGNSEGWHIPEEKALPILKEVFDKGINTWDTVHTHLTISNHPSI